MRRRHDEALLRIDALAAGAVERSVLAERIELQQREIERRTSLRWWLAVPFRRLWRALKGSPPAS
jgi:hypothetical protein